MSDEAFGRARYERRRKPTAFNVHTYKSLGLIVHNALNQPSNDGISTASVSFCLALPPACNDGFLPRLRPTVYMVQSKALEVLLCEIDLAGEAVVPKSVWNTA